MKILKMKMKMKRNGLEVVENACVAPAKVRHGFAPPESPSGVWSVCEAALHVWQRGYVPSQAGDNAR